jgi:hypothetical protein
MKKASNEDRELAASSYFDELTRGTMLLSYAVHRNDKDRNILDFYTVDRCDDSFFELLETKNEVIFKGDTDQIDSHYEIDSGSKNILTTKLDECDQETFISLIESEPQKYGLILSELPIDWDKGQNKIIIKGIKKIENYCIKEIKDWIKYFPKKNKCIPVESIPENATKLIETEWADEKITVCTFFESENNWALKIEPKGKNIQSDDLTSLMYYFETKIVPLSEINLRFDIWDQLYSRREDENILETYNHYSDLAMALFDEY